MWAAPLGTQNQVCSEMMQWRKRWDALPSWEWVWLSLRSGDLNILWGFATLTYVTTICLWNPCLQQASLMDSSNMSVLQYDVSLKHGPLPQCYHPLGPRLSLSLLNLALAWCQIRLGSTRDTFSQVLQHWCRIRPLKTNKQLFCVYLLSINKCKKSQGQER